MLKWNGAAWACANDIDTDTNSGGTITNVVAGAGLTGGGAAGAVTVNIGAGPGILVNADNLQLDTSVTDGLYLRRAGDTMGGNLSMGGHVLSGRACPGGYTTMGAGLCIQSTDTGPMTFGAASNVCRTAGAHMCKSSEIRGVIASGIAAGGTLFLDWMDDQDAINSALYVSTSTSSDNPEAAQSSTAGGYARCCLSIE